MVLADSSAWFLSRRSDGAAAKRALDQSLLASEVAICDMVRFELLYSTRNAAEMAASSAKLDALHDCPVDKQQWERALGVYRHAVDSSARLALTQCSAVAWVDGPSNRIGATP